MEWIKDRNPKSPGMYAIKPYFESYAIDNFWFAYFDGEFWRLPQETDHWSYPSRKNPEWSTIDWGKDGLYHNNNEEDRKKAMDELVRLSEEMGLYE